MTNNFTTARTGPAACAKTETLEQRLACIADAGPQAIEDRLVELESEWTAGRVTKAVLGVMIVVGFALAAFANPWWLILPIVVGFFLLQYLFNRSSWLGMLFHEMGFRHGSEVDQEKMALKVLRGDFQHLPTMLDIESHDDISRLEGEGGITVEPNESKIDPAIAAKVAVEAAKI